ncbi:unnamed protein product [Cylindrotheca closterium]|uniref:S-adenosylmethionine-dependent methyltransferase domain-containing protein n=1 Tax=Cylindrotheca closterium TaxID=2856 RepID=A0AAD2FR21_9STRA|nr:unnamed protein product [Cylindrotheca closterium]
MEQEIQDFSADQTDAKRVFHGRGGCYPGCEHLTLDWFPPVWLLTSHNIQLSNDTIFSVHDMLPDKTNIPKPTNMSIHNDKMNKNVINLVYQFRNDTGAETRIISGGVPKPHVVTENGMKFLVGIASGKNNGIFLDMANGRKWVQENTKDQNVLNMFAYTCGFSVAALGGGGAAQVVNIDMAGGPMKNGKRNHDLNNLQGARFLTHNIFKTWGKLRKLGPYDTIIVDPPSFQRNSFVASKDYCKILRRLPDFLKDNGKVLLCLNAPSLDSTWLKNQVEGEAPSLEFLERLPNPDSFPDADPERSLKVLLFQKKSSTECQ